MWKFDKKLFPTKLLYFRYCFLFFIKRIKVRSLFVSFKELTWPLCSHILLIRYSLQVKNNNSLYPPDYAFVPQAVEHVGHDLSPNVICYCFWTFLPVNFANHLHRFEISACETLIRIRFDDLHFLRFINETASFDWNIKF